MPSHRILIIEDNEDTCELLRYNLEAAGFDVHIASDGLLGFNKALEIQPDLILLDLMLPKIDGLEVCRKLKMNPATAQAKILMLTAKADEVDRIVGLELGADDYVVKPFSLRELILRVKAVLRRTISQDSSSTLWEKEGLRIDFEAHSMEIEGKPVILTATEFKLLSQLVNAQGKVCTRDYLLSAVWDTDFEGYSRTVDTHVRRLRQKLGVYAKKLETVRGVGYRFQK